MTFNVPAHIKGLIFDFDGTLVDTMPLHYVSWQTVVQARGGNFPEALHYAWAGVSAPHVIARLNEMFGYQLDIEETTRAKEEDFSQRLQAIKPLEPVMNVVRANYGKRAMAVASGGARPMIVEVLKNLKLSHYFEAIVSAEDVEHPKPAPDTFLKAAQLINIAPQNCMVFEDADFGLQAAGRAGMVGQDIRLWLNGNGRKGD